MKLGFIVICYLSGKRILIRMISILVVGIFLLDTGISSATADQFDTVSYIARTGISFDDNLFRLSPDTDPKSVIGQSSKSEEIRFSTLGIHLNKGYSNQKIILNAEVTSNQYNTFSFLDYNSTVYKAAWNWSFTPWVTGVLGSDHSQTLNDFANTRAFVRNLNTVDTNHLNADWWFHSNWHVLFGGSQTQSTSTVNTINNLGYLTKSGEAGLKYFPDGGRSISLITRRIEGNYIDVLPGYAAILDNGFTEWQDELLFNWQFSGKSTLSGNVMYIDHRYPFAFQRDYSGIQAGLTYTWSTSGLTLLNISLNRKISPWWDSASNYYVTDTVSVSSSWQISSKILVYMSINNVTSDFLSPAVPNASTRYDLNQTEKIGVDWTPQRSVTVSATIQHSLGSSNLSSFNYDYNTMSLSAQLAF